jgi:hypothetical protein
MAPKTCLLFDVAELMNDASEDMGCLTKNDLPYEICHASEFLVHPVYP